MKNIIPYIIIVILLIILLPRACSSGEKSTTKTTIVYKDTIIKGGEGVIQKPTKSSELPQSETDTVFIAGQPIYVSSPVDEELKKELEASNNKLAVLLDAARQREYSQDFNDSLVDINVKSKVYGKLDKSEVSYKFKDRTIKIPEKTIEKTTIKNKTVGLISMIKYNQDLADKSKNNVEGGVGIRINKLSLLGSVNTQQQVGIGLIIEF